MTTKTYDRMPPPDDTAVCVSSDDDDPNKITIAVGPQQRINCDLDDAHAVFRALAATLFAGAATQPAWTKDQPDVTRSARTGKSWPVGVCVIAVPHREVPR